MLGGGNEGRKVYSRRPSFKGLENSKTSSNLLNNEQQQQQQQPRVQAEGPNPTRRFQNSGSDEFSGLKGGFLRLEENMVRVSLYKKSKREVIELRRKLEGERDMLRSLMRKIEVKANEGQKNAPQQAGKEPDKVAAVQPRMLKPLKQLSVSVHENSKTGMDNAEKEKRTPKVNKLYRNSDFLLGKDKMPPAESNKKLKSKGKKGGGSGGLGLDKIAGQVFKSCSALLEKLMKHKHAWVFNKPVDTVGLGLHDYFEIIKNPMDLGTVKDRLARNWYSSPLEFAEDVSLTFRNAMMYNPKGQDVYVMAEQLAKIFEEKWALIQADHMREFKFNADFDVGSPLPTSRKAAPPQSQAPRPDNKDATDMANRVDKKRKKMASAQLGKAPTPKKPKARDPNKREMMYEEKQKLSINLQNLPSEKLESVVHIIKKRNPSVSQQDDEIEVDIDSVDTETLWELDRFITNYKKSLSKSNRKAEVVGQVVTVPEQNTKEKVIGPVLTDNTKGNVTDEEKVVSPPAEIEEPEGASQSSSSSGSGSSSTGDSDGESSSADGSDGRHSSKN